MTKAVMQKKITAISQKIAKEYRPEKIILFGSWAWGTPGPDSDIDLFIIKTTNKHPIDRMREVDQIVANRDVALDILVYTPKQTKNRLQLGDPFVKKIVNAGKILYEEK